MGPIARGAALESHDLLVIADDLAGAAETAAALLAEAEVSAELRFAGTSGAPSGALVVDTDSRYLGDAEAAQRVDEALRLRGAECVVFKKIDSLLRGRIAAEVGALRAAGRDVVVAAALPELGRTVRDGVVHVDGVPLHRSSAWGAERDAPPDHLRAALGGPPGAVVRVITRDVVHDPVALAAAIDDALAAGEIPACDGETAADLDAVVTAALGRPRLALVGTSALARSLARRLNRDAAPRPVPRRAATRVLVVAGTLAPTLEEQLTRLADAGAARIVVDPDAVADPGGLVAAVAASTARVTAVSTDRAHAWHRDDIRALAAALGPVIDLGTTDLVLTGGETARRVLEALGATALVVERELAPGVAVLRTPEGAAVVTRPGSFGGPGSLVDIVDALTGAAGGSRA